MAGRIEDYALIGDCKSAALVGRDGSIDWLCWPRFDSGACFAALLGGPEHGRWLIGPASGGKATRRRYRGKTFVLETDFETGDGTVTVIDFMSIRGERQDLIRLVVGRSGRVAMRSELVIRFGYGDVVPWVNRLEDGTLRAIAGPDQLALRTPAALRGEDLKTISEFTVAAGETVPFTLSYVPSHVPLPLPVDPGVALGEAEVFWTRWAERCRYEGPWADAVVRSHLVLKALTYAPTGGIVAAPTTSLPELLGGPRNWDYRHCWLRDSTFSLLSLMNAGYFDEAQAWRDWLLRTVAGSPDRIQIMYGLAGERDLAERELGWLPGYECSQPVRIGNAAHRQLQLDVYGEVMDTLYHAPRGGLGDSKASWGLQRALVSHLETIWQKPDEGIWEVRSGRHQFTHSKVMAWVALDRAIRSAEEFRLEAPLERWRATRNQIHEETCRRGYNVDLGSFVQCYDGKTLDASLLLIPLVGFLPVDDPRVRGTVKAIEQRLLVEGFVLRYNSEVTEDGLPAGEGAFLACSFWLADNFVLLGRDDDARKLFERLLAVRNDVGLLAEEYNPRSRRQLGNFPQAFSHVALADTARNLTEAAKPARQRSAP
ncbi:glycoside hydrolase family 15 protein [Afipia birgiae]|jgi:GH15 family glucan-1,4-alpha-glucosidase|uniref:glycoside hydrolase family 15 protein n=1 Tax=Afipia birgiae TaxID=151414 RepID=UPI00032009E8|nr:glycoside hydrolase family 15 protein [Afipia birgiae]MBX9822049.1 glycoside hydrolase family 15 protein [Afipia birgiae]